MRRRAFGGDAPYKPGVVFYQENIILDGTNHVDTGLKLLSKDYDFDIEIKMDGTTKQDGTNSSYGWLFGLSSVDNYSISAGNGGFCLRINSSGGHWMNEEAVGSQRKSLGNFGISKRYNNYVLFIRLYKRGNQYRWTFQRVNNTEGNMPNNSNNPMDVGGFIPSDATLTIGAHKKSDGTWDYFYDSVNLDYVKVTII